MQKTYKFAISLPKLLIKDLECGKRKECWPAQGRRRDLCQDSPCSCTFEKDRRMQAAPSTREETPLVSGIFANHTSVIFPCLFNNSMLKLLPKGPWETEVVFSCIVGREQQDCWWMSRCPGAQCHHQDFTCQGGELLCGKAHSKESVGLKQIARQVNFYDHRKLIELLILEKGS